jgi:hypothetical protein
MRQLQQIIVISQTTWHTCWLLRYRTLPAFFLYLVSIFTTTFASKDQSRPRGIMATHLTSDQEILGSSPDVVINPKFLFVTFLLHISAFCD